MASGVVATAVGGAPGVHLERRGEGNGRTVLVAPGEDGVALAAPFVDALAASHEVVLCTPPGWRQGDALPVWLRTVDALSYLYLDVVDEEVWRSGPVHAVGVSFGAWILLEAATKSPGSFASLTLVSPVGVKLNGREETQFEDLYVLGLPDRAAALYGDAAVAPDLLALDDATLTSLAVAQEATARFGWVPYLHSAGLQHRLHRVSCPVLVVAGAQDRFVRDAHRYYDDLASRFGGPARVERVEGAGHRVEEERPAAVAGLIEQFVDETAGAGRER